MRRTAIVLVVLAFLVSTIRPASAAVRYRDEVFGDIVTTKDLKYGEAVNRSGVLQELRLDVHEPAGDTAPLRAAVVWVHGGFFTHGSKEDYRTAWTQFAKAGYVTFSISYRLHPTLPDGAAPIVQELAVQDAVDATEDAQHDAQAAVRWVRQHAADYRIDPERVAIAGHSAGGITAQRVLFNDHDPGTSGNPGHSSRVAAAVSMAGGSIPGVLVRIDPLEPPLQLIHGAADDIVPFPADPPACLVTVLLLNTCEMVIDPDQDHGTFGYEYAREFLYRQMISKPTGLRPPVNVTLTGLPSA
jgi:dienelactone hydrolase